MDRSRRVAIAVCLAAFTAVLAARADRRLVWTTAAESSLEKELNTEAARGLRLAAVSDGLPCPVAVLQTTETPGPPGVYAVVADKDLDARLPALVADGFVPRFAHRAAIGRTHVIFERMGAGVPPRTWRTVAFDDLTALPAALSAASAEGYQPRLLVRYPLKSWPGLSERGLILVSRPENGKPRETQVVVAQVRALDAPAREVEAASARGFAFDLLFTGGRGDARRDRLVVVLSREVGTTAATAPIHLERTSSFGAFGNGAFLGAAPFWDDDYAFAWSGGDHRQAWASPIRLSANDSTCGATALKLRVDGPHDERSSIVALIARHVAPSGYELVYVLDERMGAPRPF